MKKHLPKHLTLFFTLSILLLNCTEEVKTYDDPRQKIQVNPSERFIIKLPSDLDNGYVWMEQGTIDTSVIRLMLIDHQKSEKSGKFEYWHYTAMKPGKVDLLLMYYIHPDRNTVKKNLTFHVVVNP